MKHKMNFGWVLPLALLATVALASCSESATAPQAQAGAAPSAVAQSATAGSQPRQNRGVVRSNQMAGGYSYIEVDIGGDIYWVATAISNVKPGDEISWNDFALMRNFKSKSLNREFSQILFVDRIMTETDMASSMSSGTVIESMNAAGYSYLHVEDKGARVWLAVPETRIKVGESISWNGGAPMRNFTSKSLNRNFDEIFFVSAVQGS